MSKHFCLALVGVAGLASSATMGAVNTSIVWQVSMDNQNWSSSVNAAFGMQVYSRALVSYTGTAQPIGLASFVFQPTISNWTGAWELLPLVNNGEGGNTSNPVGVVTDPNSNTSFGRMSPWGRTALSATNFIRGHIHSGGSGGAPAGGWMRIAQSQASGWMGAEGNTTGGQGVPISQLNDIGRTAQDPAFNSSLQNILVFKFAVRAGVNVGTFVIDSPTSGFGNYNSETGEREVYWFGSMTESTGSIRGAATVTTASINILFPSPSGAMAMLMGFGVLGARRVRRGG